MRFGRLPNGLRYAIQHNETPRDGVAMRLRIGSGSLQEHDDEQGLAHFLEHMAFRGSTHVPDGEVVNMLQRQGLAFGADTNAFTAWNQTVYHFDFPKADAAALDTGLMLFNEIGRHLTLEPELIEQEKGVVLSEERLRDVPGQREAMAELDLTLAGTLIPKRWPIGRVAIVQAANAQRLRRFYVANYRADNATVIVVGNIDVDAVERRIRQRFSDWAAGPHSAPPDMGTIKPAHRSSEFVADGAPPELALTWLLPPDNRPHTLEVDRAQKLQRLACLILNLRLSDRALQPASPFVDASADVQPSVLKVVGKSTLKVGTSQQQWRPALEAVVETLRQLMAQGVQPSDLQRALPAVRNYLQAAVARAPTRSHGVIADLLVSDTDTDSLHKSDAQQQAETEPLLASVTPEQLTAELRRSFGGDAPLIFLGADGGPVGAEALIQQLSEAMSKPLAAATMAVVADWPYTDFGVPGVIVARSIDAELGTTTVQFANGTRLVVKPIAHEKDKVNVQVLFGQGRAGVMPERTHAIWTLDALKFGGTGKRSLGELMQWQQSTGKQFGEQLRVDPFGFALVGDTRPADLTTQLQVLAAFQRDPGFRSGRLDGIDFNAEAVYAGEVGRVLNGGESRLSERPTAAELAATREEDLPGILRTQLAGAADVVIVGDVSVNAAIAATQATIGAGPSRPRLPRATLKVVPPADGGAAHVVIHYGRADQAVLGEHWPMPDFWADPALARVGTVAAAVMQARLTDTVRGKLGITYSPSTTAGGSFDVPGQGSFAVQVETPPDRFNVFRHALQDQLHHLAAKPVGADELRRAKQPLIERSLKELENNAYWAFWLPRILADGRIKSVMLDETASLKAVTAEQVQAYFRDHVAGRQPIEIASKARSLDEK